jgi:hypothetical protein
MWFPATEAARRGRTPVPDRRLELGPCCCRERDSKREVGPIAGNQGRGWRHGLSLVMTPIVGTTSMTTALVATTSCVPAATARVCAATSAASVSATAAADGRSRKQTGLRHRRWTDEQGSERGRRQVPGLS